MPLPGHEDSLCVSCSVVLLGLSPFQAALSTILSWRGGGGVCALGVGKKGSAPAGQETHPRTPFPCPGSLGHNKGASVSLNRGASGVGV